MLDELKRIVLRTAREAERQGLCRKKSGNFSCRDAVSGYVVMTPRGVDRQLMTEDDIIVMDMGGQIVEALTGLSPTSEAFMHLAAYETRPDVRAVVHTHSKFALTFAVAEEPIPAMVIEAAHLKPQTGYIPLAAYARQGTRELAASIREPLTKCDGILLAKHGVLTVGDAPDDALLKAMYVEDIAEIYFNVRLLGKRPGPLPPDELKLRYPWPVKQ